MCDALYQFVLAASRLISDAFGMFLARVVPVSILLFLSAPIFAEEVASNYRLAMPCRAAVGQCDDFKWVSDLPYNKETYRLFEKGTAELGLPPERLEHWRNEDSSSFLKWLVGMEAKGDGVSTLILYFSSHQRSNGRIKFSKGEDLEGKAMVEALNSIAGHYARVLFVNDSCYASSLEHCGQFAANVIRLYSSNDAEESFDLEYRSGPYGLEEFVRGNRIFYKEKLKFEPRGMSFLAELAVRAARNLDREGHPSLRLQDLYKEMSRGRDLYDEQVRQRRVQHFVLVPADADMELLAPVNRGLTDHAPRSTTATETP